MERLTNKELCEGNVTYGKNNRSVQYLPPYERYMVEKLKEYEDLEEQGLLLRLPTEYVYCIVDENSKWGGMVMAKSINDLTLYEIEQIDKRKYYSTKEAAEAALKEMEK